MEERYLTVTALTKYIKYKFDHDRNLESVLLEGEISNFKHNSRGHFYFTIKDANSQISAAMFASYARNVGFEPEDGMKVLVKGKVSVYEPSGTYQITVTELKQEGIGNLYLEFERLKKKLSEEGLFDINHKRPLPRFPKTIGVITSPTGAAIQDIINTIKRRYPICRVILYPAIVQGDGAKDNIVKQIVKANTDNLCDVLIVGRGGGSIEDLWAFNEEVVAHAIYDSAIPIISAVGHEIDYTIADFVADIRAVTPTAGAEIATPNIDTLKENVNYYLDSYNRRLKYIIDNYKLLLMNLDKRLENLRPDKLLSNKREYLNNLKKNLDIYIKNLIDSKKHQFEIMINTLEGNNPLRIMDKGYSISSSNGKIVTDVKDVKVGDTLKTEMKNGYIVSNIVEVNENGK